VKKMIQDLLANEDPAKPLSDQEVAQILKGRGADDQPGAPSRNIARSSGSCRPTSVRLAPKRGALSPAAARPERGRPDHLRRHPPA